MDKLTFLTQYLQLLAEIVVHLQEQISSAQDSAKERSLNQIMGSLYGLSTTAEHLKTYMKQWFWWLEKNRGSFLDYQIATTRIDDIFEVIMSKEQERSVGARLISNPCFYRPPMLLLAHKCYIFPFGYLGG